MSHSGYTVPIQRVQAFAKLADERGWDFDATLQSAGMSPSLLSQGRSRVTGEQVSALVRRILRVTDDELLGLGLKPVPCGTFRLLGFALLSGSTTVREVLVLFAGFKRAVPGICPLIVTVDGDITTLTIDIRAINQPLDLLVDTLLAATHRTLVWAISNPVRLRRVDIPHALPPEVDDYDVIFGAPIKFCAPAPALVFDTSVLDAPIVRSHAELDSFLRNAPAEIMAGRGYGVSVTARVRRILQRGLTGPWPSSDEVAAHLAMSPQTLRRKLRDEGTSWSQIRDDLLRDAAITSLANGGETIAQLSDRLGFSEPSAFTRAFRRWTGNPPGAYRPPSSR